MSDTPRCTELSKRHAALTEGAMPMLDEGATLKAWQGALGIIKTMIQETWALAEELERELAEKNKSFSETVNERDELERRLEAVMPLFEEARDALPAISLASAKLHNVRLDLGDRMDDVGVPERWEASQARKALEAK